MELKQQKRYENWEKQSVDDVMVKPLGLEGVCHILQKWFPDKTIESDGCFKKEQDSEKSALLEAFSTIDELDVKKGLNHLANSANNYIKVIKAAVDNLHAEQNRLSMYQASQFKGGLFESGCKSLVKSISAF